MNPKIAAKPQPPLLTTVFQWFLGLALLLSLATYFTSLAQYSTPDQGETLGRLQAFITDFRVPTSARSHVANFLVGIPGHLLKTWMDEHYQPQDQIVPGIHYTPYLPFTFVSVIVSLLLLFQLFRIFSRLLGWNYKTHLGIILTSAFLLLNSPTLKAEVKILKYDSLSILLSMIGLLLFIEYQKTKHGRKYFWFLCLTSLAYYEKDTGILILFFGIAFEVLRILYWENLAIKPTLLLLLRQLGLAAFAFLFMGYLVQPITWNNPLELFSFMKVTLITTGLSAADFLLVAFAIVVLASVLCLTRSLGGKILRQIHQHFSRLSYVALTFSTLLAFVIQKTYIYVVNYLPPDQQARLLEEGYFQSPSMMRVNFTTFDHSHWITRAKWFFSWLRISLYGLPEATLLILLLAPLYLYVKKYRKDPSNILVLGTVSCCAVFLGLCSTILFLPMELKYNSAVHLLLTLAALCILDSVLKQFPRERMANSVISFGILVLMLPPCLVTAPSYFGYFNVLRNRKLENSDFLEQGHLAWTWNGWSEGTFPVFNYLGKMNRTLRIGLDDLEPFHYPTLVEPIRLEVRLIQGETETREWLKKTISENKLDYVLISKSMAYRYFLPNYLVKNFRDKALFVEKRAGIEYSWLFDAKTLTAD